MLGTADKVTVSKDNTTIVNGAGDKENIKERCEQIKAQIVSTKSDYDKEKLQERLAKLSGGVAVLYVGAASEVEMKEKKDRVDDALRATLSLIHISEPTRQAEISYAVFCLKKKKKETNIQENTFKLKSS